MTTEQVTRNRTGPEPLETIPESEPFATGFEPGRTAEQLNRRKKLPESDQRTVGQFTQPNGSLELEPYVHVTRPGGSLEPVKKPAVTSR